MRLGFMTNILVKKGMVHLDEIAEWAAAQGFEDLEVGPTVPMERESCLSGFWRRVKWR